MTSLYAVVYEDKDGCIRTMITKAASNSEIYRRLKEEGVQDVHMAIIEPDISDTDPSSYRRAKRWLDEHDWQERSNHKRGE